MANGQVTTSGQGSVVKVLSVALVGLVLTSSAGTVTALGNQNAALTGAASTTATGTVVHDAQRALTGRQATFSQGAIVATGRSLVQSSTGTAVPVSLVPLVGQSVESGQGLITPNADGTIPLVGSGMQGATGTVLVPGTRALTGSESATAAGTLGLTLRPTDPVGQSITTATGVVSIQANDVTVHITGELVTATPGFVDATPILTGHAITGATGLQAPAHALALIGLAVTGSQGALTIDQAPAEDTYIQSASGTSAVAASVPLVGSASTTATGTLAITGDVFQALTGIESVTATGLFVPTPLYELTGQFIFAAQENMGAPGFAALSGQVINGQQGTLFVTNDRTQALTGTVVAISSGTVGVNSRPALLGLLQQTGIGTMGRSGGNMQFALTGASSTGHTGTLGVIGQDILPPGVSNEGCSIVSDTAVETETSPAASGAEGCFIQSGTAKEV